MTTILDGKAVAAQMRRGVAAAVAELLSSHGWTPGLDAVLVGDDPASHIYVRNKRKACEEAGIRSELHILPATTPQPQLERVIATLNADKDCDGILVQIPLPDQIHEPDILELVDPRKDVDGFHPINLGRLLSERPGLTPATPTGILHLLQHYKVPLAGAEIVVVGRSAVVGKPMAALLMRKGTDATVTVAHSRTKDLGKVTRRADVLIVAMGKPRMITADMVKPGAVVVDVGINRLPDGKVVGDVDFDAVSKKAAAISPVPGGVGPLTIAQLLVNVVRAGCERRGVAVPPVLASAH